MVFFGPILAILIHSPPPTERADRSEQEDPEPQERDWYVLAACLVVSHLTAVLGVLVLNREGYRVHQAWSSASSEVSEAQSDSYWQLARRLYHTAAESLYAHDAQDRVALLTLRTSKLDLIFAPGMY